MKYFKQKAREFARSFISGDLPSKERERQIRELEKLAINLAKKAGEKRLKSK